MYRQRSQSDMPNHARLKSAYVMQWLSHVERRSFPADQCNPGVLGRGPSAPQRPNLLAPLQAALDTPSASREFSVPS